MDKNREREELNGQEEGAKKWAEKDKGGWAVFKNERADKLSGGKQTRGLLKKMRGQ